MGQSFIFFNIDKRQCWGGAKFGEMLPSGGGTILKLCGEIRPDLPDDPLEGHPYVQAQKIDVHKASLSDFPVELQSAIFEEIQDPIDVFALCLCSIHFWMVGVRRLKALYIDDYFRDNWAGDRIICLGDYADDLPAGMLTDAELKEHGLDQLVPPNLYNAFSDVFGHKAPPSRLAYLQMKRRCPQYIYDRSTRHIRDLYKFDFEPWMFHTTASIFYHHNAPPDSTWVLRNLSKKVYVRADKFALDPEDIGPDPWTIKGMFFGSLVASRIAWSSDSSMAMQYSHDHDLHRGVWAGDRFDIVDIQKVEEDWIDVTAEAKKELGEIWESEFGDDWEEIVVESGL